MYFLTLLLLVGTAAANCRCRASEKCWPSTSQWQALNGSISGLLTSVKPLAYVCHDPNYNEELCAELATVQYNSTFLTSQPGAMQYPNYMTLPEKNETCYIGSERSIPCGQGRAPLYSAGVLTAQHIQEVVRFAVKHNVRLVIKNTGHSYTGGSAAPDSLQILTHGMTNMTFSDNFTPAGGHKAVGSAVTVGAGVYLAQLYAALGKHNLLAVAGLSHTVGAAGGYIQGGGHSPVGTLLGMASDNALQFTVVTAQGSLVVANDHQNADLFWALRGGGGGTFGVVVDVTIRTFPDVPLYARLVTANTTDTDAYWAAIERFHTRLPALNDAGASGFYYINSPQNNTWTFSFTLFFVNFTQAQSRTVDKLIAPLVSDFNQTEINLSVAPLPFPPSAIAAINLFEASAPSDQTGFIDRIGSRLISHSFLASKSGPERLTSILRRALGADQLYTVVGHMIAGGKVASGKVNSALNPAWRKTLAHVVVAGGWDVNASLAQQKVVTDRITKDIVPALKKLEPSMGAYLNEADQDEEGFQASFWGCNYPKLRLVKRRWDPDGVLIARRGVGSEDWDYEGMCRR